MDTLLLPAVPPLHHAVLPQCSRCCSWISAARSHVPSPPACLPAAVVLWSWAAWLLHASVDGLALLKGSEQRAVAQARCLAATWALR